MEGLFFIGFIIYAIFKAVTNSSEQQSLQKALNDVDLSEFIKNNDKISGVKNNNNNNQLRAIEDNYDYQNLEGEEVNGFVDPSISFIPTEQPKRISKKQQKKNQLQEAQLEQVRQKQQEIYRQLQARRKGMPQQNEAPKISFGKNDILKAFIMQELLQRHDINKIYERIPDIRRND